MTFTKLVLLMGMLFPISLAAQSITAKLQINPIHVEEYVPLSIGGSLEIGISPKSSFQIAGIYRLDKQLSQGINRGPKYYLDYRYYPHLLQQKNSGFYISLFVGYGNLQLAEGDEPTGDVESQKMEEALTGLLIGYQPYKKSRFSVDLYAGPEYQWRTKKINYYNGRQFQLPLNRIWFRGGISLCIRLKR